MQPSDRCNSKIKPEIPKRKTPQPGAIVLRIHGYILAGKCSISKLNLAVTRYSTILLLLTTAL